MSAARLGGMNKEKPGSMLVLRSCLLAALVASVMPAIAAAAAVVLGPAESRLQLSQISAQLAGRYDNDPQRYYLEGMKRGATAPARLHVLIRPVAEKPATFTIEERDGSEHDAIARQGTLTLEADATTRQIIMKLDAGTAQCAWNWSRRNTVWMATPQGACAAKPGNGIAGKTLWLGPDEFWLESAQSPVATELGRAHEYECYIALKPRDGKPNIFTGLRLHDRGGTLEVKTNETPSRALTLSLRRGMWPSNSGNNLTELLSIYLHEPGSPAILGSGWATPEASRVGFGTEEEGLTDGKTINSRCKRID